MSTSGLCQICESRPAEEQCRNCGTFTCQRHYEDDLGLCAECAAQADPGQGDGQPDPDRDPNDEAGDTYQF